MIIASIFLPVDDNDGKTLVQQHLGLADTLIAQFGGVTAYDAKGFWRDPATGNLHHEAVRRYDVFVDVGTPGPEGQAFPTVASVRRYFRYLAQDVGQGSSQIAMSIVVDGNPEIITVTP